MSTLTIKTAGEEYKITLSRPVEVAGEDVQFAGVLASLVEGMLMDYSPAFGDPAAFVSERLKQRLGATVVAIDAPAAVKGMVY
jgi:hypothetical protein